MDPHWASVCGSKRYFYCGISVCPEAVGSRAEGLKSVLTYDREKCRRVCGVDDGADNGLAVEANWGSASHAYSCFIPKLGFGEDTLRPLVQIEGGYALSPSYPRIILSLPLSLHYGSGLDL